MAERIEWTRRNAREWIAVPTEGDDKYSRGVLGVVTGSDRYPGAAVLGVEAAARTGVGMIRYLGAPRPAEEVLRRRPEAVSAPGRVQAWLLGSGMDAASRPDEDTRRLRAALADGSPLVLDAGALDLVRSASAPVVITPHYRELVVTLRGETGSGTENGTGTESGSTAGTASAVTVDDIRADPAGWAVRAAATLDVTVLLKGHTTHIATPDGRLTVVTAGPPWLATAGSGDVLGGILGALLATHAEQVRSEGHTALAALAATAAWVHGRAGEQASAGAPIVALDIAEALPTVLRTLLTES